MANKFFEKRHRNPFQNPRANPKKYGFNQINGESMQTQHDIILERETRKRS